MSILDIALLFIGGAFVIITAGVVIGWVTCEICWRWEARRLRKLAEMERKERLRV